MSEGLKPFVGLNHADKSISDSIEQMRVTIASTYQDAHEYSMAMSRLFEVSAKIRRIESVLKLKKSNQ